MKNKELIEQCYEKSIELLKSNSTRFGVLASSKSQRAVERNYLSIFARDASICSLGMIASRDKELIKMAKNSLLTLAKFQADNGQIPNYIKPQEKVVDFWRIACIDANLWWLIAVDFYNRNIPGDKLDKILKKEISKAIFWLRCQEHPNDGLLVQNEASDWADIMPRSGKVLYSNSLWCRVKELYKVKDFKKTKNNFNNLFYPFDSKLSEIAKCEKATVEAILKEQKPTECYLDFVNYLFWGKSVDVYANSLIIVFNLTNKKHRDMIVNFLNKKTDKKKPIPTLFYPIVKDSKYWRKYMESHNQNLPYQYHNGGIWPFVSCFWAVSLKNSGKSQGAWEELDKIALANSVNDWQFNEWFHAKTFKPQGMIGQSWNAGMFVFAYNYLKNNIKL